MDEKTTGVAGQASWGRLIGDELNKAVWFTFSLIALATIFCCISDGDSLPKIPYVWLSAAFGFMTGVYRGFYSAFRYASGKFPRGARAGILSGAIYFTVVGAGMMGGYSLIFAGYGVRACVIGLLAAVFTTFLVLFLENEDPAKQPSKE